MLFENIEKEAYKDQKLSLLERSIILVAIPLAKVILWKIKKAKTYGDLMKLNNYIESKLEKMEIKYGEDFKIKNEADVATLKIEAEEITEELKIN